MQPISTARTMQRNPARQAPKGFTLVELLVVIGIIALLISILLPALSKARESANQVKCSAQQKQILLGMILHANDHKGYMPLAGSIFTPTRDPKGVDDLRMEKYEYYGAGTGLHITSTAAGVGKYMNQDLDFTSEASLSKSMLGGTVRKVFSCPSDKEGGRYGKTVDDGGAFWSSFAFNEGPLGWAQPGDGSGVVGHKRLRGKVSRFPHPSALMMFCDAAPRGPTFTAEDPNSWQLFNDSDLDATLGDWLKGVLNINPHKGTGDPQLVDRNRHKGRIIVAFADGHVENLKMEVGTLDKVSLTVDFGQAK